MRIWGVEARVVSAKGEVAAGLGCGCLPVEAERPGRWPWLRLGVALAAAGQGMLVSLGYNEALARGEAPAWGTTAYWLIHGALASGAVLVAGLLGWPLVKQVARDARRGRPTLEMLFALSLGGAFGGSVIGSVTGEGAVFYEVVAVVVSVYTLGRMLSERSRARLEAEVAAWRERLAFANLVTEAGSRHRVAVAELPPGARVSVTPGELVTVGGVVEQGRAFVNEGSLSGEPRPRAVGPGDRLGAGVAVVDGELVLRTEAATDGQDMRHLLRVLEGAPEKPARAQAQADRILRYFVPVVVATSVLTGVGWLALGGGRWWEALFNGLAVLLVACPCALGLATPIAIWRALQHLAQGGLVARHAAVIDDLAAAKGVVFDKTGTLTEAEPVVGAWEVVPEWREQEGWLREAVASIESRSGHPFARALVGLGEPARTVTALRVEPGLGVEATVEGRVVRIGRPEWAWAESPGAGWRGTEPGVVGVGVAGRPAGRATVEERARGAAEQTIRALRAGGLEVAILSGDPQPRWRHLGGVAVEGGLNPEQKVGRLRELRAAWGPLLYVGDGLNDAPALAHAGAAIALGTGASLAQAAADAVLDPGRLETVGEAVRLARTVTRSLKVNLWIAAGYNVAGMGLAAAGQLHPVWAALIMVTSSAVVSVRALRSARAGRVPNRAAGGE